MGSQTLTSHYIRITIVALGCSRRVNSVKWGVSLMAISLCIMRCLVAAFTLRYCDKASPISNATGIDPISLMIN
jgi:hypothetical protein